MYNLKRLLEKMESLRLDVHDPGETQGMRFPPGRSDSCVNGEPHPTPYPYGQATD